MFEIDERRRPTIIMQGEGNISANLSCPAKLYWDHKPIQF